MNKKYHWYSAAIEYRKDGKVIAENKIVTIGLSSKRDVLNRRVIAKATQSLIVPALKGKNLLCNGSLHVQIFGYLGYFRKGAKPTLHEKISSYRKAISERFDEITLSYIYGQVGQIKERN